jgi:hypothetical protein
VERCFGSGDGTTLGQRRGNVHGEHERCTCLVHQTYNFKYSIIRSRMNFLEWGAARCHPSTNAVSLRCQPRAKSLPRPCPRAWIFSHVSCHSTRRYALHVLVGAIEGLEEFLANAVGCALVEVLRSDVLRIASRHKFDLPLDITSNRCLGSNHSVRLRRGRLHWCVDRSVTQEHKCKLLQRTVDEREISTNEATLNRFHTIPLFGMPGL